MLLIVFVAMIPHKIFRVWLCCVLCVGPVSAADFRQLPLPANVGVAVEPSHRAHALTDTPKNFHMRRDEGVWMMMEAAREPAVMNPDSATGSAANGVQAVAAVSRSPVEVRFEFNKSVPTSTAPLAGLFDQAGKTNTRVHVIGHADEKGSDEYNQKLSERRARSVADWFKQAGIPAAMIHVEGRGKREPVDPADAARNRRATVQLITAEGKQ
ncbi:OmpA family protein [Noviherbaspirillum sp. CPCC 100848]|uniref:OmpA family protein n=1 Tax=Noviherbaspirillum album TaxID=3080276 RepID=A0ABU6J9Y8_9BURK|nr:OmpA family protein [Noviherbaspirillum sp. CPCC 100848]MEC4720472.1 OmpA family protein [Noviherbaspirillum sp. CPCC 100848]